MTRRKFIKIGEDIIPISSIYLIVVPEEDYSDNIRILTSQGGYGYSTDKSKLRLLLETIYQGQNYLSTLAENRTKRYYFSLVGVDKVIVSEERVMFKFNSNLKTDFIVSTLDADSVMKKLNEVADIYEF